MRIDFVITELFVGGAERCLTELAIGLAQNGDDIRVFSLGSLPTGDQAALVERMENARISIQSGNADSPLRFARAYRQLRRWFEASKPDLCQTFLFHANVLGTMAALASGVPIRVGGLRVAEAKQIRCQIEKAAVSRMTSLVCVSRAVGEFAQRRLACSPEASVVIPNGVDVSRFSMAAPHRWSDLGWPDDSIVTLFVGRLHQQKGIELLQQQIDAIAPPGSARKLLIVGDGPLGQQLDSWCESIGPDRVRRIPWQADVAPLMKACRVLVLPSRYEGMPNVAMEAMAAGRPVVCSRAEGSEELFAHCRDEQTFAIGDSDTMKKLIEPFLADASLSDDIGALNQSRVRNDFSIPAMIDAYRSHYRLLATRQQDG